MKRTTKAAAVAGLIGVVAVPVSVAATATPAFADRGDREKTATCGSGVSQLNVDREDGGFEVGFETDRVKAGSTWKVVLRHDGKVVANQTRTADGEGEYDVERYRPNTAGKDVFSVKATNTRSGLVCGHVISLR